MIALGAIASIASADYFKTCEEIIAGGGVDGKTQYSSISIRALRNDTRYTMFKLTDLPNTNIPFMKYGKGYDFVNNKDGFHICNEDMIAAGKCAKEDAFTIRQEETAVDFYVSNVKYNDEFRGYTNIVDKSGIYCVLGYHESPEKSFEVTTSQAFGSLGVPEYYLMTFMKKYLFPLDIVIFIYQFSQIFKSHRKPVSVLTTGPFFALAISLLAYHTLELSKLSLENSTPEYKQQNIACWVAFFDLAHTGLFLLMVSLFYTLSRGAFILGEVRPSKTFVGLSMFVAFVKVYTSTTNFGEDYNKFDLLMLYADIFAYLPVWILMFKHSKATQKTITDPEVKRKFTASRRLTIFTPISLFVIGAFSSFTLSYMSSKQFLETNSDIDPAKDFEKVFIHNLENILVHAKTWSFLENMSGFSIPIILIGYNIIWRNHSDSFKPIEGEDLNGCESFDIKDIVEKPIQLDTEKKN